MMLNPLMMNRLTKLTLKGVHGKPRINRVGALSVESEH